MLPVITKDVNFYMRRDAEQFAQFVLRVYQFVHRNLTLLLLIKEDMVQKPSWTQNNSSAHLSVVLAGVVEGAGLVESNK